MSGAHEDSHVLKEMGLSSEELGSSFRISIGKDTTIEEIDYFVDNLKEIVKIERGNNTMKITFNCINNFN